jgi:membrane protease subunit (stomatin/prohibitin family)
MSAIQFVENYQDLSTDRGYQFKFHCDRCNNGYLSTFEASMLGMASGFLNAANSLLGGVFGRAAESSYQVQQAIGGKAHDSALQKAVEEIKAKFKQCHRCGKWVCPEVCWNATRQLCMTCAPDLNEEIAAAQAQVGKEQIFNKAAQADLTGPIDWKNTATAKCAKCGADVGNHKFCPECGTPSNAMIKCDGCGAEMKASAKFCPDCGKPHKPAL